MCTWGDTRVQTVEGWRDSGEGQRRNPSELGVQLSLVCSAAPNTVILKERQRLQRTRNAVNAEISTIKVFKKILAEMRQTSILGRGCSTPPRSYLNPHYKKTLPSPLWGRCTPTQNKGLIVRRQFSKFRWNSVYFWPADDDRPFQFL